MQTVLNVTMPILSFLICILVAYILGKTPAFNFLNARENRFKSLDGIRGFLALSVFFHHFVITYYWKDTNIWASPPEKMFDNFGSVGVAIFFIITGFLFISKITKKSTTNWVSLYKSRFFRIVPLYIFALVVISLIVFASSEFNLHVSPQVLLKDYIKWGLFHGGSLNGFSDTRRIIAGVDWTLKYEWFFYFCLPLISLCISKLKKVGMFFLVVTALILFIQPLYIFSFKTNYLILFCIGGLASYLVKYYKPSFKITGKTASTFNLLFIITAMLYPNTLDIFHVFTIAIVFLLTLLGNDLFGVFTLRSSVILGEISYSIYLLHGIILYLLFTVAFPLEASSSLLSDFLLLMPVTSVVVVLISATTFLLIEKPCMSIGKK
ncbi:acyltransferase [Pseudoalteromonas sp. FUC4]|uniref:acyltransferase family protein n=1 Tax=Pseudoalteromonas sp. FUC4 TaxID=2511201 RepID=UPI0011F196B4|nr:acyltransferase [Pseudoalteromonas sp. FUC4]KAA1152432.1 acyltransferase [Pseudoalteromonas sp. FUC4]